MNIGDRFDLSREQVHGYVTDVMADELGDPVSVVVALDGGAFAAVDLRSVTADDLRPTLQ